MRDQKEKHETFVICFLKKLWVGKVFLLPIESNPNEFTIFLIFSQIDLKNIKKINKKRSPRSPVGGG